MDPILLEVINNRLQSISNEMEDALLKMSFSVIVKEMKDCTCALFDAQGRTISQSAAMPCQLGFLSASVPAILKEFPPETAREGDVYMQNDPFNGGSHIPDVTVVMPVFYDKQVVAYSASMVHLADTGGITPGVSTRATCMYQEGLCLPPVKFYDAGQKVRAVHEIIRQNVRIPDEVMGDLEAQVACDKVGASRIADMCREYGKDVFLSAIEGLLDHSEALTRKAIEELPDGVYRFTGYIDNDGLELDKPPIRLQLAVTISGSEILFDFTGSSQQVKGPINCVFASTLSTMEYAVKVVTGGESIPTNEGCFRSMKYILPEGSIVNATKPAPTGERVLQLMQSRGGITSAAMCAQRPVLTLLSGPAAGVIGGRTIANLMGRKDVLTLDLGGTSNDVALIRDGKISLSIDGMIGSYPCRQAMMDISTIGAGGGSIG